MRVRRLFIAAAALVAAAAAFVGSSVLSFALQRRADFSEQRSRLAALSASPSASARLPDEALPESTPFGKLRSIATHNSYRKRSSALRLLFVELAKPGEAAKLAYGHPAPWDQLEAGIRSFELDLRYGQRGFECAHVPLVDDRSAVPDFALALREISLWSKRHPGHAPITLLLELKDDYRFLDPTLSAIGGAELGLLDETLSANLGPRLFKPDELRGSSASLSAAVADGGWPSLGAMRGRVIAILHADEGYRRLYLNGRSNLEGRAMFTSVDAIGAPGSAPDAAFAILNDPLGRSAEIAEALSRGLIVRTRADADCVTDPGIRDAALASGAQIVSTDFPPSYPAGLGYSAAFAGGATLSAGY